RCRSRSLLAPSSLGLKLGFTLGLNYTARAFTRCVPQVCTRHVKLWPVSFTHCEANHPGRTVPRRGLCRRQPCRRAWPGGGRRGPPRRGTAASAERRGGVRRTTALPEPSPLCPS